MNLNSTAPNRTKDPDAGERAAARAERARIRSSILTDTVTRDVIPRLLAQRGPRSPGPSVTEAQIAQLADLTLHGQGPESMAFATALLHQGVDAETLYLDLLSPAAALLGQYWVDDVCNFADVTVGLVHLQRAMRALAPAFFGGRDLPKPTGPHAFLLPLPGEQHTFGLSMLADFFRRAGWHTWSGAVADTDELRQMVSTEWVDLVGFSLACDELADVARREIAAVRRASKNPNLVVMVGGPPFVTDPSLAQAVGADGTAKDGSQAVSVAQRLLPRSFKERGRDMVR